MYACGSGLRGLRADPQIGVYTATSVGGATALLAFTPLLFDLLPLGGLDAEYHLWGAAVVGLLQLSVVALVVAWVRPSEATRAPGSSPVSVWRGISERDRELHRAREDRAVFGVCGGAAAYLGVSSERMRWAVVFGAIVVGSVVFVIYALLAFFLEKEPDANTIDADGKTSGP